ncbi:MAG: hypothetical protein EPO12_12610 [Aquabacterium sp.]|jgi:NodT family efflux transporter outer membrane factor (OMF) lipoprotein|nr:MAG: hypothetical protein EPO12_12610 [Aquabacterium sp.]
MRPPALACASGLRRLLGTIVLAMQFAGCAGVSAPRETAGPTQRAEAVCEAQAASAWWTSLGDPQLDALVDDAMAGNADLAQATARLEQARALYDEAQAGRRPRLDAGVFAARERVPRTDDRAEDGTRVAVPPYRQSRLSARLEAGYEVDLLGRLREAARSADAQRVASACDLAALRRWVAREVVLAYSDLQLAEAGSQANAQAQALAGELESAQAARLQAGTVTQASRREAAREVLALRDEAADLVRQRQRAHARIAVLAGGRPGLPPLHAMAGHLERAERLSSGLPAALGLADAGARPDVAAAWMRVTAAAAQAQQVRLERYPTLTLSGSAGYLSDALRRWLKGEALAWVAEAALSMPVLDGGRADARQRAALAVLAQEQAAYRATLLQAAADLGTALAELDAGMARVELARRHMQLAEADHAALRAQLRAGLASRPAALQAQRDAVDAAWSLQQQRHALLAAWVGAQQALGR